MRLGVIGGGIVGHATARAFLEHVEEVRVYDVRSERRTHSFQQVMGCDLIFLCLPTPQKEESLECDTSVVEKVLACCASWDRSLNFVLRSTVPIGFTRRLREQYGLVNLVHSPEFATARCAVTDAQMPARNIVGRVQIGKAWAERSICSEMLRKLYERRFPGVPVFDVTSDESEAVKLALNSFFAVKVAYWNEVRCLSDKLGLDWDRVIQAVLADGRISPSHTQVPGPDGRFGFGGSCLPKDLASLVHQLRQAGLDDAVTGGALERNRYDRERQP